MEEIEVPTEHLHEAIQEEAEKKKERWTLYVALSTAFMAVLAALAGLLAGHHSNEAMIEQLKASDQWSYYQAKSIKSELAASTVTIIHALGGKPASPEDSSKLARYEKEKEEIKAQAEEHEKDSKMHLDQHIPLARSVTIFQIAIAVSAIAILTRKKVLWYTGIVLSVGGIVYLLMGSLAV